MPPPTPAPRWTAMTVLATGGSLGWLSGSAQSLHHVTTMAPPALTAEQVEHFLAHGWIKLTGCFTRAQAQTFTRDVWTRLGMSPTDKSTWTSPRVHMPYHRTVDVATFAPTAWSAICELLGGEARIAPGARVWGDGLIVNLGSPDRDPSADDDPRTLDNWHVDGDFFVHYLDSPEQALLVVPLWEDIPPGGGGTMLCPPALGAVARHLFENPAGVSPRMTPRALNPTFAETDTLDWYCGLARATPRDEFVEACGRLGDVFLLHPLTVHSASRNLKRWPRFITNPPVRLAEPFVFDRGGEDDPRGRYSIVERATLRALGKERLEGWRISADRQTLVPERVRIQAGMKRAEEQRLKDEQMA